jgi:protein phosphatase
VHPQRSVITRALGTDPDVDVDAFTVQAQPGDIYLICSDGLSDMVDGETIEQILVRFRADLSDATKALIAAANRGGGDDNITAVVFEIADDAAPGEPDEKTREYAAPSAPARELDEEDTLHPEDQVQPPAPAPTPVDTMVVPAAEIRAAVAADTQPQAEAGVGRRLLALSVILLLIAVIVFLVWWGLAR